MWVSGHVNPVKLDKGVTFQENVPVALSVLETKSKKFIHDVPNVDCLCAGRIPSNQLAASNAQVQLRRMMKMMTFDWSKLFYMTRCIFEYKHVVDTRITNNHLSRFYLFII